MSECPMIFHAGELAHGVILPDCLPEPGEEVICIHEINIKDLALHNLPTEGHPKFRGIYRVEKSAIMTSLKGPCPALLLDFDAPLNALGEPLAYSIEYFHHIFWRKKKQ